MHDGRIEYLIRLVEKSEIAELEIVEGWGRRIRIAKYPTAAPQPLAAPPTASASSAPTAPAAPESAPDAGEAASVADDGLVPVVAPMVGTFYRASAPDAQPFVDVGSQVESGHTLCIIEAMKIMNEITSEVRGSVRKILVENGQPVEFGQTLFLIEKSA